ncbi:hypothetical protein GCM10023168_03080 [Fodinibacter luteus]|uniref:SPOR domain-containing protein n=1 Tax=Fodinibacter luteus TaxID=552064 RepID=A0ABP8JYR0_9MICO
MRYLFVVSGSPSAAVEDELPEMAATTYPTGGTALFGPIRDQADVMSVLARLTRLGLSVVEMRPLPD